MSTPPNLQAPPHLPAEQPSDPSAPAKSSSITSNELIAKVGEWKRQIGRQIGPKRPSSEPVPTQQNQGQRPDAPTSAPAATVPPPTPQPESLPPTTSPPLSSTLPPTSLTLPRSTPRPTIKLPTTGIRIQTTLAALSSGFAYTDALFSLSISPATWTAFTNEVVSAARISIAQRTLVVGTALGVGVVGLTTPLGVLSVGPAIVAGKVMYDRQVVKRVKGGHEGEGKLGEVLRKWNEDVFQGKGVVVSVEVPEEAVVREKTGKEERKREKVEKKKAEKEEKKRRKMEKKKKKKDSGEGEAGDGGKLAKTASTVSEKENSPEVKLENEGKFKKRFQLVILPLPAPDTAAEERPSSSIDPAEAVSPLQHHESFGSTTTMSPVSSELDGSPVWERQLGKGGWPGTVSMG